MTTDAALVFKIVEEGSSQLLQDYIAKGKSLAHLSPKKNTLLHAAVIFEHASLVRLILQTAPELVDARDAMGRTALMLAARFRDLDMCVALLRAGCSRNLRDDHGYSALDYAVFGGSAKAVVALVYAGCDVNSQCPCGLTALHRAVSMYFVGALAILAKYGARPLPDHRGQYPIHLAAMSDGALCKMLVAAGHSVDVRNHAGYTPRELAHVFRITTVVEFFEDFESSVKK